MSYQDENKTKKQLISQLHRLREQLARMEAVGASLKESQKALIESEQRYRNLVDASPIPIVLCTGFCERVNEENFKAQGIDVFLMKPLVRKEISRVIHELLEP